MNTKRSNDSDRRYLEAGGDAFQMWYAIAPPLQKETPYLNDPYINIQRNWAGQQYQSVDGFLKNYNECLGMPVSSTPRCFLRDASTMNQKDESTIRFLDIPPSPASYVPTENTQLILPAWTLRGVPQEREYFSLNQLHRPLVEFQSGGQNTREARYGQKFQIHKQNGW